MLLISLAANFHDSAVAISTAEEVLTVIEAERVTRKKKQWSNRAGLEALVQLALTETGYTIEDVTHWSGSAMGNVLLSPEDRSCDWTAETQVRICGRDVPFLAVNHHLAHAASFFAGPFESAVVDTCDGGGDGRQHVVYRADRGRLRELDVDTGGFTGVFYDVCSFYLYGRYCQEGKFMGLASFGKPDYAAIDWLSDHVEALSTQPHEISFAQLHERFGIERMDVADQRCLDFAHSVQAVFEAERVKQLAAVVEPDDNIVLAGGSALNIHANTAIRERFSSSPVYVPPCCDDTGQALGALLYQANVILGVQPNVQLPFVGLGQPGAEEIEDAQAERVVDDLLKGRVIAWHFGRSEIGPRALGHRSLLCVPFTTAHRVLVSEQVKHREAYRPVAPVLLAERRSDWFTSGLESPFMLFADKAQPLTKRRAEAVVHIDGSARIQTVEDDHVLAKILRLLDQATGVPMLINTSLNSPGEPITQNHAQTMTFAATSPHVVAYLEGERQG